VYVIAGSTNAITGEPVRADGSKFVPESVTASLFDAAGSSVFQGRDGSYSAESESVTVLTQPSEIGSNKAGQVWTCAFRCVRGSGESEEVLTFEVSVEVVTAVPTDDYYGTVAEVIVQTDVQPADLGIGTQAQLEYQLAEWLKVAKSYIDADRKRTYAAPAPAGIQNIAVRIVANIVVGATQRRKAAFIKLGDSKLAQVPDECVTESIRTDLESWPKGRAGAIAFGIITGTAPTVSQRDIVEDTAGDRW
jgi:hypothetical protein